MHRTAGLSEDPPHHVPGDGFVGRITLDGNAQQKIHRTQRLRRRPGTIEFALIKLECLQKRTEAFEILQLAAPEG
jgi:hypothetical protein